MKAVNIFLNAHCIENALLIDMVRQRQLHQDTVHGRVGIQALHQRKYLCLSSFSFQVMAERLDAHFRAGLLFSRHIGLRGGILTD